jgi:flagellar motor protein MotB
MSAFDKLDTDENVGWPGYVDFLSTFVFVLIIFIGSLLYLLSGDIVKRTIDGFIDPIEAELTKGGITSVREENKVIIPLSGKVEFATNQVLIRAEQERFLRQVAPTFGMPGIQRIIVRGHADSQKCPDPFCNWEISARRAQEVLKFFYNCTECGYGTSIETVRRLLVLSGEGDTSSAVKGASSRERRVDIILDFNANNQ